jgi:hypothetical protein
MRGLAGLVGIFLTLTAGGASLFGLSVALQLTLKDAVPILAPSLMFFSLGVVLMLIAMSRNK